MPRPIGTTFADLLGKLQIVRVECSKCGRFGRYPLHRLIDQHGGNGTIIEWLNKLTAAPTSPSPRVIRTSGLARRAVKAKGPPVTGRRSADGSVSYCGGETPYG